MRQKGLLVDPGPSKINQYWTLVLGMKRAVQHISNLQATMRYMHGIRISHRDHVLQ